MSCCRKFIVYENRAAPPTPVWNDLQNISPYVIKLRTKPRAPEQNGSFINTSKVKLANLVLINARADLTRIKFKNYEDYFFIYRHIYFRIYNLNCSI